MCGGGIKDLVHSRAALSLPHGLLCLEEGRRRERCLGERHTPLGEAGLQQVVIIGSGEAMASGAEVVGDGAERNEELLRVVR